MRAKVYSSPPSEALTGLVSLAPSAPLRAASAAPIHSIRVFPSNGQGSAFDVKGPECGESLSSGRKEAVYRAPEMTIGGGGVLRAPSAAPAAHSASAHPAAGALPAPGGPFSRPRGDLVAPSTSYASKWVPGLARDRGSERPRAACAGRSSLAVRARAGWMPAAEGNFEDELDEIADQEDLFGEDDRPRTQYAERFAGFPDESTEEESGGATPAPGDPREGAFESLESQLQSIYEEQQAARAEAEVAAEAEGFNPTDVLMRDWPPVPQRQERLAALLRKAGVEVISGAAPESLVDVEVLGLHTDSRKVQPEDLFICLTGEKGDGHDYALEAYYAGACAIVASRPLPEVPSECPVLVVPDTLQAALDLANAFYDWPSRDLQVIAVTGTNGKTTTSWLIRSVLEEIGRSSDEEARLSADVIVGMIGTIEYAVAEDRLDEEGELWLPTEPDPTRQRTCSAPYHISPYRGKYSVPNTTPGPVSMAKLLAGMRDRGATWAVLEASSHGLRQGRLAGTDVDVAVFTNLTQDHLDYHGSMDEYKRSKLMLFEAMAAPVYEAEERLAEMDAEIARLEGGGTRADLDAAESLRSERDAEQTRLDAYLRRKRCVVNLDDPYADEFLAAAGPVTCVTYARHNKQANLYAAKVESTIWESTIEVEIVLDESKRKRKARSRARGRAKKGAEAAEGEGEGDGEVEGARRGGGGGGVDNDEGTGEEEDDGVLRLRIVTPLIGEHNVLNVLAAVATGLAVGVPLPTIVGGIEQLALVPGRMEIIDEGQGFPVIVDYAHTPDALSRLLDAVKDCQGAKRIITVVGCGGDRDRGKRPLMAEVAHYKSDIVIFTNDNPRTEEPDRIIADMVAGLPPEIRNRHAGSVHSWLVDRIRVPAWFEEFLLEYQFEVKRYVVEDRFTAIRLAIGTAVDKDVVVIAGKGHGDYIEYGDGKGGVVRGWFDDAVEARNALSKLPYLEQITKLGAISRAQGMPWRDKYGD